MPTALENDTNYAGPYIYAAWALTGVAGLALAFRYTTKTWIRWMLPRVSSPERVWGLEDILYGSAYAFDIAHMVFIQRSFKNGLGRHMWFLSDAERKLALKNEFISQPLAVTASMLSRSGMMCFLYTCFSSVDKQIRLSIIVCMAIQVVVNSVTAVQIIVQCGPNPYHAVNRVSYFHYMWDNPPADGSVICQSPAVQTTIGFVQGGITPAAVSTIHRTDGWPGFNTTIDFFLTALSAVQLWRYTIRATDSAQAQHKPVFSRIRRMPRQALFRRIWQTISLSGPLLLSGIASIVKTYLLKTLGERNDITHNTVPFILWVKIENYSILLATFAPMIRLFVSMASTDKGQSGGYWSNSRSKNSHPGLELDSQPHTQKRGAVVMSVSAAEEAVQHTDDEWKRASSRAYHRHRSSDLQDGSNGVTVRTEIVVQVSSDKASTERLVL
ncbi:uncharacterized protein P174DRAFT_431765 [Aspergillus novofumigatus IBT 16806]|uniref:Rhodopsin domain-containing protein n=1 Tax=Aspergillus novofumigatus (strain IBT 16806) TaxID=1392255 RepID=A0A2I1C401_ASPN1|nr:uncharacterized protein P174DRAFT_431765 [Aspergillus novofumigatus IBT 16806]PKX92338.1 hypothetical protein P174DRAFT_431765 [Aspergillus novofumigatus IBT 16806]